MSAHGATKRPRPRTPRPARRCAGELPRPRAATRRWPIARRGSKRASARWRPRSGGGRRKAAQEAVEARLARREEDLAKDAAEVERMRADQAAAAGVLASRKSSLEAR